MKKFLFGAVGCIMGLMPMQAQTFEEFFTEQTLRIDYQFVGNVSKQAVCVDKLSVLPHWAGRRNRLTEL